MPVQTSPAAAFDFSQPAPATAAGSPPAYSPGAARPAQSGLVLTPLKLVLLAVLVLFGIGLSFAGGLLLGLFLAK